MIPTNNDRRIRMATESLGVYGKEVDETYVCDLLTDLMHWCDHNDVDFAGALSMARYHHEEETKDELEHPDT